MNDHMDKRPDDKRPNRNNPGNQGPNKNRQTILGFLIHVCRFGRDCFFSRLFSDLHPRIRGDNGAEPKC